VASLSDRKRACNGTPPAGWRIEVFEVARPLFHMVTLVAGLAVSATAVGDRDLGMRPAAAATEAQESEVLFHDAHVHIWNFVQKGPTIHQFLEMMGSQIGRSVLFGLPLQQQWSYHNSGDFAPSYYLQTDAPLYYYSFTDAALAMAYKSLPPEQQARFDPMIIGFNPATCTPWITSAAY
jgi:hypothetical protein